MKFFVTSDIHSFFEPFIKALEKAGFDKNNKEHYLIVCGDSFDRGPDSLKLLHYLMSLERKVLIKGNHDILLEDCCKRGYPQIFDYSNGTTKTIEDFGGFSCGKSFKECCQATWDKTAAYRKLLVNYFETEKYIFVHSWIPTITHYDKSASKPWHQTGKSYEYREDWRKALTGDWEEAMWRNPFELAKLDLNKTNKTIVFGHWHCSTGWSKDEERSEFGPDAEWNPYFGKGIIGIDRCTAHTGEVNVIVIEDNLLK